MNNRDFIRKYPIGVKSVYIHDKELNEVDLRSLEPCPNLVNISLWGCPMLSSIKISRPSRQQIRRYYFEHNPVSMINGSFSNGFEETFFKIEQFDDALRIFYHLTRVYGEPDEWGIIDIPYHQIDSLPEPPKKSKVESPSYLYYKLVDISKIEKSIIFIVQVDRETEWRSDEYLSGPFLKKE